MPNDLPPLPVDLAREIARQGEVRLAAIMALATAADLRATTLCGIFGTAAVGTGAAVLVDLASEHPSTALIVAGTVTAIGIFVAALIAAISGAPRDFYIAGGNPDMLREWSWTGRSWRSETEMLDGTAARQAQSIAADKAILRSGSRRVAAALWIAFAAPLFGVLAYFLSR
ncbi:MAG TPA: hypothetical protein VN802_19945 [Stellaceae bacterium]|nr:hypothetical protein [Stellaceae bacterium]